MSTTFSSLFSHSQGPALQLLSLINKLQACEHKKYRTKRSIELRNYTMLIPSLLVSSPSTLTLPAPVVWHFTSSPTPPSRAELPLHHSTTPPNVNHSTANSSTPTSARPSAFPKTDATVTYTYSALTTRPCSQPLPSPSLHGSSHSIIAAPKRNADDAPHTHTH